MAKEHPRQATRDAERQFGASAPAPVGGLEVEGPGAILVHEPRDCLRRWLTRLRHLCLLGWLYHGLDLLRSRG